MTIKIEQKKEEINKSISGRLVIDLGKKFEIPSTNNGQWNYS